MIFFSKLITVLLLPPGCFILGLLLLIFFIPRRFKIFLGLLTAFFYLLSIHPVSDLLLKPLENAYPPLQVNKFCYLPVDDLPQAVVILGGGTVQGSPEAGAGQDALSAEASKRAVYAFTLRDVFPVPFVFSGGKVFDNKQDPEAAAAGRLFDALGLPPARFIPETESRNTWENARETAKLDINQAILVTSAYHMKRSVFCFERNGVSVIPAPTDYKCDRGRGYDFFSFMPSMGSLRDSWLALHEYVGLGYYRVVYDNSRAEAQRRGEE